MTTEKVRIYDLAKRLKLPNKAIIDLLAEKFNIEVKSHASTIEKSVADKLASMAGNQSAPDKTQITARTQIPEKSPEPEVSPAKNIKEEKKEIPAKKEEPVRVSQPATSDRKEIQDKEKKDSEQAVTNDSNARAAHEKPVVQDKHQEAASNRTVVQSRPESQHSGNRFAPGKPKEQAQERQDFHKPFRPQQRPEERNSAPGGPRPQKPYDRKPRPFPDQQGQRTDFQQQRQERPPYNRPQGQRPPYDRPAQGAGAGTVPGERPGQRPPYNRPQGQRPPYDRPPGQRPPYDRPPAPGTAERTGQRPFQERAPGQRPGGADNRPQIPARKPVVQRESLELPKASARRDSFGKKKEKEKSEVISKEEKFEQSKLIQDKFKKKKKEVIPQEKEKVMSVIIDKPLTVGELAGKLDTTVSDVIKQLMMSGILATVNQTIDTDTIKGISEKLGYTIIKPEEKEETSSAEKPVEEAVDESGWKLRAPVVTIMGHVDHGKTTLLDAIRSRKHKIVNTEVGGITQSIGAYTVRVDNKRIVFIDTPGHEAFTAMRARGAQSTDIAILVVAADDGIMPQTIEAINHAKAAKVPVIVAVNKIDKAGADPDRVLQQLTEYDLVPEKWGGDTICINVSALQEVNIDELLEMILLVAELEELKADYDGKATGVIIEARLDKGKGAVATLLVQSGTLRVGDYIIAGTVCGRIRALLSDEGERIKEAKPSTPVEILGLGEVPQAGDRFEAVGSEKMMKAIANQRKEEERISHFEAITPAQIRKEMILQEQEQAKDLNIIIKANTHGSAEAVSSALQQLVSKQVFVKIVHIGIGDISEADVMLASASNAIIIGFSVKEDPNALRVAANSGVDIRKYDIIYQIIEDIEKTMLGLLQPEFREVETGTAEIRQVFTIGKTSKIAGCYVLDGKVIRSRTAKILRNGKEIYKGSIAQLKRFKDDVKEVAAGYECGISFNKFNDIQEGDIIKILTTEEVSIESSAVITKKSG